MTMTVKTFNTRRKFFGKLVFWPLHEAGTGCAGIIKPVSTSEYSGLIRIPQEMPLPPPPLPDKSGWNCEKQLKVIWLLQPHYLRKIGLGIGQASTYVPYSELLQCQTGFVDGTCRRVVYILPENGKGTPHGKMI